MFEIQKYFIATLHEKMAAKCAHMLFYGFIKNKLCKSRFANEIHFIKECNIKTITLSNIFIWKFPVFLRTFNFRFLLFFHASGSEKSLNKKNQTVIRNACL